MSAVVQTSEAAVSAGSQDHRETGKAAEVGAGEEKETETSGQTKTYPSVSTY